MAKTLRFAALAPLVLVFVYGAGYFILCNPRRPSIRDGWFDYPFSIRYTEIERLDDGGIRPLFNKTSFLNQLYFPAYWLHTRVSSDAAKVGEAMKKEQLGIYAANKEDGAEKE